MQVLTIGKISSAVVLAGAAYQDEAGYARMTGIPLDKTRLIDDKGDTDIQALLSLQYCIVHFMNATQRLDICWCSGD